jgi:tRNA (adenine-N(1)-)-methyltransferase non-catalytic subunit
MSDTVHSQDVDMADLPESRAGPSNSTKASETPQEPLTDVLHRRVTVIREGDNVLLKMPSDAVKTIVASSRGYVTPAM